MSGHKNGSAPEILINKIELFNFFIIRRHFLSIVTLYMNPPLEFVKMGNVGLIPGIKSPWQILRAELKNRPVVTEQEVRGENFSFQCFHCEE